MKHSRRNKYGKHHQLSIRISWSLRNFESQRLDTGILGTAMELRLILEGLKSNG